MRARVCACVYMHTCIYAQTHTHTLTLTYIPLSVGAFISVHLEPYSPPFLPGRAGKGCVSPPPLVLRLPPKSSEIAGSACGDAGSNLGLIFGSTCDMASFTSHPVVVSMSFVREIVHAHTDTHIHTAHPKACLLNAGPVQFWSSLLHFRLFLLRQLRPN